jgi:hypothetical protein
MKEYKKYKENKRYQELRKEELKLREEISEDLKHGKIPTEKLKRCADVMSIITEVYIDLRAEEEVDGLSKQEIKEKIKELDKNLEEIKEVLKDVKTKK